MQTNLPESYDPNFLLNRVMDHLKVDCDTALARQLKIARNLIADIRSGRLPVCATLALMLHQATGLSMEEIRKLMGDRRARFRVRFELCAPRMAGGIAC